MCDQKEYMARRGVAKGSITRLVKYADSVSDKTSFMDIKSRLELLERSFIEFTECEMKLAILEVPSEMEEYETKYLKVKAKLSQVIAVPTAREETSQVEKMMSRVLKGQNEFLTSLSSTFTSSLNQTINQSCEEPHCSARLPRLNIPTFSGDYKDFACFKDLYTASVHSKLGLTEAEKFQYLKGYLRGEAADLIKHITVSEANYTQAWTKLCERYDKKRYVLNNLIQLFLEQPSTQHSSAKGLRRLYNVSDEVIRGLEALGDEANRRDAWLIHLLLRKTDRETQQAWAHKTVTKDFPSLEEFLKFISERADALEACEPTNAGNTKSSTSKVHQIKMSELSRPVISKCLVCGDSHRVYTCPQFKSLDIVQRREKAAKVRMCFNCLAGNHRANQCQSQASCMKCGRRHHTLLHDDVATPSTSTLSNASTVVDANVTSLPGKAQILPESQTTHALNEVTPCVKTVEQTVNSNVSREGTTLLPTAAVELKNQHGQLICCKLLMDSGSQTSFISEKCVRKLGIVRQKGKVQVEGLATSNVSTTGRAVFTVYSRLDSTKCLTVNAYILPKITTLSGATNSCCDIQRYTINDLPLADPHFDKKQEIDILLGADYFFYVLAANQVSLSANIVAQETLFGYVVAGRPEDISNEESKWMPYHNFNAIIVEDQSLENLLRKFWEQETILEETPRTTEEELCETMFTTTTTKNAEGRFVVQLPLKTKASPLGDSYKVALQRLLSMERKMSRNSDFKSRYIEFLKEYEGLGHMKLLQPEEIKAKGTEVYYLPHHGVLRENSLTTKLRVVFDGSARSSNGTSLNDNLLIGSRLQDTLWAILLRFRSFKIAICADIAKMYRQILIDSSQTPLQRILWRNSPSQPIGHYELLTVTYGTSSAPFLAVRVLFQIADDCELTYPKVSKVIRKNFYVDDVLTGADDEEEALMLKNQSLTVFDECGFSLTKWRSNISKLSDDNGLTQITEEGRVAQVLGLYWEPQKDYFSFKGLNLEDSIYTKRGVLSVASRIFDPLGWLSPFTVLIKVFMQSLWLRKLSWDERLSQELQNAWTNIQIQFKLLNKIEIPRYVSNFQANYQIHGFSDASEVAYSAAVYVRVLKDNHFSATLLTSKSKVAPIQPVSLPRLELCGAHLLTKLVDRVIKALEVSNIKVYMWSDSMVVLSWLSNHPRKWKTYVANRVASIHQLLPESIWRHVKGRENPADLATRGISVEKLVSNDLWWNGPSWLSKAEDQWPINPTIGETLQELHVGSGTKFLHINIRTDEVHPICRLLDTISSWTKIVRVMAYILRFLQIVKNRNKPSRFISVTELENAEIKIIQSVQYTEFAADIQSLTKFNQLPSNSRLRALVPFIDASGTLRVGGRLQNLKCAYNIKHPIIVPRGHIIGKLILNYLHQKYLHPGPSLLTALSRQKYWILGVRTASRSICQKCIVCFRHSTLRSAQQMGSLPESRITVGRPFSIVGVDYAGPVLLASKKGHGAKLIKGFLVIFVCFITKALHIEVASDLTTDAFLAALDRFVARRGAPAEIYSDNGSNFLGAKRKLYDHYALIASNEFKSNITEYAPSHHIKWHFIPPISPHFGGLWERAVRSVKTHLIKVTGAAHLTFEEMITIMAKIEGILNSRPLCAIRHEDTCNIDAITAAHFLTLGPITALPCPNYEEVNMSSINRWERVQKLVQTFWRYYSISYLNTLQQRSKWQVSSNNLELNDVVLLHDSKSPPCHWPLGRVIELHKGNDGLIRVATVQTKSSSFKRPITKLYRLPLED